MASRELLLTLCFVWAAACGGGSSTGAADAGTPGPDVDRGACDDPFTALPTAFAPRCAAATLRCVEGCRDRGPTRVACEVACVRADTTAPATVPTPMGSTTADCNACVSLASVACMERAGCRAAIANYYCCLSARCPAGSAADCGERMCAAEFQSLSTCAPQACREYGSGTFAYCYARDGADGGAPDGG